MKQIVIIEDDPIVGKVYRNKLSNGGFAVDLATSGQQGIALVESKVPELILLDLRLPDLTGAEVIKAIRANETTRHIPIVVLSNAYVSSDVGDACRAGATKVLLKSTSTPSQVFDLVTKMLASTDGEAGPTDSEPNVEAQEDRGLFLQRAPVVLQEIRDLLQMHVQDKQADEPLHELHWKVHNFATNARQAKVPNVFLLANALEALLRDMYDGIGTETASTVRAAAQTVDLLVQLVKRAVSVEDPPVPNRTLVVGCNEIDLRMTRVALTKASIHVDASAVVSAALLLAEQQPFDLFVLNAGMSQKDGFEFCSRLRHTPQYEKTPILFLSARDDLAQRIEMRRCGGNELVVKPCLETELALVAMTLLLQSQTTTSDAKKKELQTIK